MKKTIFKGSGVALITPMLENGDINYPVMAELIEFQIANGTDAIVSCGTTGEASTMDDTEHLDVIEFVAKTVAGRIPVVAGTGGNDTRHAINLSCEAAKRGADALLLVTPYYNKTNQSGLIEHYNRVIDAAGLPSILYNVPSRTGMTIAPKSYIELSKNELVVATKEASGNFTAIAQTAALCGDNLGLYSGNDDQIVPMLSLGGLGVISVLANVAPQQTHDMCALYHEGKHAESLKIQLEMMELVDALFCDVNPIPVKEAVGLMGYDVGACRLPLGALSDCAKESVLKAMKGAKIIK